MAASTSREPTSDITPEGAEIQEESRRRAYAGEPPQSDTPRRNHVVARSLKDSVLAAIVTFALAAPTIGLQTVAVGARSNLGLEQHWHTVGIVVGIVFFARLALNLFVWKAERPLFRGLG